MPPRFLLRLLVALALLLAAFLPQQAAAQTTQPRYCSKSAFVNLGASAATTQIAPGMNNGVAVQSPFTASPTIGGVAPLTGIYICGYVLIVAGTTPTAQFVVGFPASLPGTGCGASPTAISVTYPAGTYLDMASVARGFEVPSNNVICIVTTGSALTSSVQIYYDNNPL
jgi:hypothetical protein